VVGIIKDLRLIDCAFALLLDTALPFAFGGGMVGYFSEKSGSKPSVSLFITDYLCVVKMTTVEVGEINSFF
jgi:hypothetical protein